MSSKRNKNKKGWAKRRRAKSSGPAPATPASPRSPRTSVGSLNPGPSELDQIGVVIVEDQLGLRTTNFADLRSMATSLPFEPCVSLMSILAGRVEGTIGKPDLQLALAEEFFGPVEIIEDYRAIIRADPGAHVFAPQSLYTLMRVLVEEAYDAPITQELTDEERVLLLRSAIASNSVIERGIDTGVGPGTRDLLAYELQVGSYYSRPPWMEEMARHRELYRLATEDPQIATSNDFEPVKNWIERSGLTANEQWLLGFGLSSIASAWDPAKHPHVPESDVTELLARIGLTDRREQALSVVAADRGGLRTAFADLKAEGKRAIWELRPFNTSPFLRLQEDGGLLLLGRPWMLNWLGEGFHYRALRVAQAEDAAAADGRTNHVQRYTAFAGQVFEQYCLNLAKDAIAEPVRVFGEQSYGKGDGQKTSDVALVIGDDLILFEANARRVGAEPLLTGDPLDAANELTKLLVKKINQLGVTVGAFLASAAKLPDLDIAEVKRIFPVVVAAGHVWQTSNLYGYLDSARDARKCTSLQDPRVQPLQVLDPGEYERILAFAARGTNIAELLARKMSGDYRYRDLAVWLAADPKAPDRDVRLPAIEAIFKSMTAEMESVLKPWG